MSRAGIDSGVFKTHLSRAVPSAFHQTLVHGPVRDLGQGRMEARPQHARVFSRFLIYHDEETPNANALSSLLVFGSSSSSHYLYLLLFLHCVWFQVPNGCQTATDPGGSTAEYFLRGKDEYGSLFEDEPRDFPSKERSQCLCVSNAGD